MKKSTLAEIQAAKLPWIVFLLNEAYYAISARYVSSISLTAENCTPIPQSKAHVRGLIGFRSGTVQVVDLRRLFGFPTLNEMLEEFKSMIESCKVSHINWIETLESCVETGEPFLLATDPHECAFGRWYDGYHAKSADIAAILEEIGEPHAKLHAQAQKVMSLGENAVEQKRELIQEARRNYVERILSLLDALSAAYEKHVSELLLVLEKDGQSAAFAVDRVIGVQEIELYSDGNVRAAMENGYAVGIAKTASLTQPVLLLDELLLLNEIDA